MGKRRSNIRVALVTTAALLCTVARFAGTALGADGVVLFAPGTYESFGNASYHERAATQLAQRLRKAGISEERLVMLCGEQATASAFHDALIDMVDSVGADDLLLIVICSYGLQFDDRDCVVAADTPASVTDEVGKQDGRIISLTNVLEELAVSASQRRLLLVDGAAPSEPAITDAAARFGRLPLKTADGQWVILNRSDRVSQRGPEPPVTDFVWSLLDGITFHADGNRDGNVSVLELADYMKLYAEARDNPVPTMAGKTSGDVSLVSTSAADDQTFPSEALAANARRLVLEARKTLLLELDVRGGLGLLDRARRLCGDAELQQEIDEVSNTARLLRGEADQILPLQKDEAITYLAVLPREVGVYAAGSSTPSKQLPAGTVVELTRRSVSTANGQSRTYVGATGAFQPAWQAGEVSFRPIPLPADSVWMLGSDLVVSDEQAIPAASLRQQFLKPVTEVDESPATTEPPESP